MRKYVELIESYERFSDVFSRESVHLYESMTLLENRVEWLRKNAVPKLEPIANKLGMENEEIFEIILSNDPSKKKEYTQWLMKLVVQNNTLSVLERAFSVLNEFSELKKANKIESSKKDINKYRSIDEVKEVVDSYVNEKDSEENAIEERARKESKIIHEDSEWIIAIPKTEFAAGYWGRGSLWCTAAGFPGGRQEDRSNNMFDDYSDRGDLVCVVNKSDPTDAYQLHFDDEEYRDAEDDGIDDRTLINLLNTYKPLESMYLLSIQTKKDIIDFDELSEYTDILEFLKSDDAKSLLQEINPVYSLEEIMDAGENKDIIASAINGMISQMSRLDILSDETVRDIDFCSHNDRIHADISIILEDLEDHMDVLESPSTVNLYRYIDIESVIEKFSDETLDNLVSLYKDGDEISDDVSDAIKSTGTRIIDDESIKSNMAMLVDDDIIPYVSNTIKNIVEKEFKKDVLKQVVEDIDNYLYTECEKLLLEEPPTILDIIKSKENSVPVWELFRADELFEALREYSYYPAVERVSDYDYYIENYDDREIEDLAQEIEKKIIEEIL